MDRKGEALKLDDFHDSSQMFGSVRVSQGMESVRPGIWSLAF
jgi:hypothetical protein